VRIKKLKDFDLKEIIDLMFRDPVEFFKRDGDEYKVYVENYFSDGFPLLEGDMAFYVGYGGPGYGDVLERDARLVEQDLKDHSLSPWAAENVYKVKFDPVTLDVDFEATKELRDTERAMRLRSGRRFEEFQKEWSKVRPPEAILKDFGPWPFPEEKVELINM
jgi:acetophenone carboxylase